jgi:hypothetical protein
MFYNTDVLDSLSLHGFSLSNHQDGPLYFLKLRFQQPKNPLTAGTAIETEDGKIKEASLTMPIIASIISRTFEHHVQNDTAEYVSVQLVQINELRPISPQDTNHHKNDLEAFNYMMQSPIFTNMTHETHEAPSHTTPDNSSVPPQEIYTSKRPHLPTGETVKPPKQKLRGHEAEQTGPNSDDTSTTCENQQADHMDTEMDSNDNEEVPDSQYEFCLDHSQSTRLEVIDALGIARSISEKRYRETHHFIVSHGNTEFDLGLLKRIASRPATPPPNTRAHNESKAPPTQKK